jgi:hypothetical protein
MVSALKQNKIWCFAIIGERCMMTALLFIRSFHFSVLYFIKYSSSTKQLYSPSDVLNPKDTLSVGTVYGMLVARWRLTRCEFK